MAGGRRRRPSGGAVFPDGSARRMEWDVSAVPWPRASPSGLRLPPPLSESSRRTR